MGRRFVLLLSLAPALCAQSPAWWLALQRAGSLSARFTQESESRVFGVLRQTGTIQAAKGGRLRLAYGDGKLLLADGTSLIYFDPDARTAQRTDLRRTAADAPLLKLLLDPAGLRAYCTERSPSTGRLLLEPRRPGFPQVELTGQGNRLEGITWTDPTGARQHVRLEDLRLDTGTFPDGTFRFQAPPGTRWLPGSR